MGRHPEVGQVFMQDLLLYDAPGNRAPGLDSPDVWRFAALIYPSRFDEATPENRRKAMQVLCTEVWWSYELAFGRLREEEPRYLFEQRFVVDLDENTPMTLVLWQGKQNRMCFRCEQTTPELYSGAPPSPRG